MTTENKTGLSDDELASLTEEERAGLLEDADEDVPYGDDDDDGDEGGSDTGKAAAEDAKADKEKTAAEGDDAGDGESEDADPPQREQVPLIRADVPEDAQATLDSIKERKAALIDQFDQGDLTAKDFQAQVDALAEEAETIKLAVFKANLSREMTENAKLDNWYKDASDFIKDHPEIRSNELTYSSFDMVVRKVTGDDANAGLSNQKQLALAHKLWSEQLGIKTTPAKADPKPDPKPERKVPPTLGRVPAADISETDDGKFAVLDRLMDTNPLAYEARLAKMSAAELDEYERSR